VQSTDVKKAMTETKSFGLFKMPFSRGGKKAYASYEAVASPKAPAGTKRLQHFRSRTPTLKLEASGRYGLAQVVRLTHEFVKLRRLSPSCYSDDLAGA
jgi:hypothetical protein